MNNIYFPLICLFLFVPAAWSDEAELERQCAPYRVTHPQTADADVDYAFTEGLFWKVSKAGKESYLFGTMHSQDPRVTDIPPQVRLAMTRTRIYLAEVESGTAANQAFLEAMTLDDDRSLADVLHPEILGLLKYKADKYGIDAAQADRLQAWAAFSLIGRPKPTRALTLDQVLLNYAVTRRHEIHALESMEELTASLNSISVPDQIEILTDTLCNHAQILKDTRELLLRYMHADARGMAELAAGPHRDEAVHRRYLEIMVYDRNERMLARMLPWMQQGEIFIAVGAAHLIGGKGLLQGLADQGYTVENIF